MRIAVCTRHIGTNALTGADQFVLHSYRALRQYDKQNDYLPYHEQLGTWGKTHHVPLAVVSALSDGLLKTAWIPYWSRRHRVDFLLHLVPPICYTERRIPQLCCIFDAPQGWDETASIPNRLFNTVFGKWSSRQATHIFTISEHSRDLIASTYAVPTERISVVYPCTDLTLFNPSACLSLETQRALEAIGTGNNYLLGVMSRIIPRKNPRAYFEIFARLPADLRARCKLVLVGAATSPEVMDEHVPKALLEHARPDVVFLGRVSTPDLAGLYARAGVTLFPSRYEGFGLPVIEAMGCGALVVASAIPAIREAAGGTVPLFDPDDWEGMATRCIRLLTDPQEAQAVRSRCLEWTRTFTYEAFARRMHTLIEATARISS